MEAHALKNKVFRIKNQKSFCGKEEAALLIKRIFEIKEELEKVKQLYNELDVLTLALQKLGNSFSYKNMTVDVIDNFLEKNTVFKACGVKRWELKIK